MSSSAVAAPLAATPPMGWSSQAMGCEVSESAVHAAADAMLTSGMQRVGYEYVIVEDCWQGGRDKDGFLQPDAVRFPSGMADLAQYLHGKGLKLGLYSSAGYVTPSGRPGSRGSEFQDALQFKRWGVDYVHYAWQPDADVPAPVAYATLAAALQSTRKAFVVHVGDAGASQAWSWAKPLAQSWDTSSSDLACFTCVSGNGAALALGVVPAAEAEEDLRRYSSPGHWNLPGLLQVGRGMSSREERAQVALWSMLAAPLLTTTNLGSMTEDTRSALTNPEAIAVDQDNLGLQGFRYRSDGELDIWVRPLTRGKLAVLFVNGGRNPLPVAFDWHESHVTDVLTGKSYDFARKDYSVRDVWEHRERGTTKEPLATTLQSHEGLWLRLTPQK